MKDYPECKGCKLYEDGFCNKWKKHGKPNPAGNIWFDDAHRDSLEVMNLTEMCEKSSIFGNYFFGLSENDIEALKSGKILGCVSEYGIFIKLRGDSNDD